MIVSAGSSTARQRSGARLRPRLLSHCLHWAAACFVGVGAWSTAGVVAAQTTSLFHHPSGAMAVAAPAAPAPGDGAVSGAMGYGGGYRGDSGSSLATASWTYQPAPPMRVFSKNDIITIRVDEIARMLAEGEAEKRRSSLYSAVLTDWIDISRGRIRPDPLEEGEPAVGGASNDRFRNEASVESRESVSFNIAATVVDIRPNGNLVLEARKSIRVNDNVWESSLTGICRAVDVGPDNIVLSKDLLDLEVHKQDQGQLRDGYRRGWFTRWLDRLQPF